MKMYIIQIKKIFYRSDVKIALSVFFIVPLLIAFLISIESGVIQIGDSVFSAISYVSVIIGLLKSLFLLGVTILLIGTSVVSKEIDTGLDCSYFTKINKRDRVFSSKLFVLDLLTTGIFIIIIISSVLGWALFLRETQFGNKLLFSNDIDELWLLVFSIVSSYLEIIVFSRLFSLISVLFKYSKAIIINLLLLVIVKLLANIDKIQRWLPTYIGDGTGLFTYSGIDLVLHGLEGIGVLLIYVLVLSITSKIIYKKIDLVR